MVGCVDDSIFRRRGVVSLEERFHMVVVPSLPRVKQTAYSLSV
jgi:hypothetical protein